MFEDSDPLGAAEAGACQDKNKAAARTGAMPCADLAILTDFEPMTGIMAWAIGERSWLLRGKGAQPRHWDMAELNPKHSTDNQSAGWLAY